MVECWLPYGRTEVHLNIPVEDLLGVAEPPQGPQAPHPTEAILEAMRRPVDGAPLSGAVRPGATAAIAIDGTISPETAAASTSAVLDEVLGAGARAEGTCLLTANGCRGRSDMALLEALMEVAASRGVQLLEHTRGQRSLSSAGATSRRTRVEVDARFAAADIRVAIGEVVPDAYAGFRGPHTTLLPGLCGVETIERTRSHAFDGRVGPGSVEENPVLADSLEAMHLARVDLAVSLATDPKGRLIRAYAGGPEAPWRRAVAELGESFRATTTADADIVVVSAGGARFDFDLYNAIWAMRGASDVAKKGAAIILVAECSEGLGAEGLESLAHVDIPGELRRRYTLGGEAVHLIKSMLRTNQVILVSALPRYLAEPLGLSPAARAEDALAAAGGRRDRRTLVIPRGCSTLLSGA